VPREEGEATLWVLEECAQGRGGTAGWKPRYPARWLLLKVCGPSLGLNDEKSIKE